MNEQAANTIPINDATRCQHRFVNRTRCRLLVSDANPRFCPRHARLPENLQPDDLTPELTANPADLDTFEGMHFFLEHLAILVARNRISTRRAAVLAYITNQLLRTLSAFRKEEAEKPPQLILDAPRPIRD